MTDQTIIRKHDAAQVWRAPASARLTVANRTMARNAAFILAPYPAAGSPFMDHMLAGLRDARATANKAITELGA